MKISVLKILIVVLLVSPLALMAACGKRNNSGNMAKAPPNGTTPQDFSSLAYKPSADNSTSTFLMSDYLFSNAIKGDKDNKRVYVQMSLFFIRANAADKTANHQYSFFYREFVTCQDGPTSNKVMSFLFSNSGDATLVKGGKLILKGLGEANKVNSKKTLAATFLPNQPIHNIPIKKAVTLSLKTIVETLETYKNLIDPKDPDMSKSIKALDCSKAGSPDLQPSVPYGGISTTPDGKQPTSQLTETIQDNQPSEG